MSPYLAFLQWKSELYDKLKTLSLKTIAKYSYLRQKKPTNISINNINI